MVWRDLWVEAKARSGIKPKIKDDYAKIMAESVRTAVNADEEVKRILLSYIRTRAFEEYKSAATYQWAAILPAMFIQWLAEIRKKEITLKDLNPPKTSRDDADEFAKEYASTPAKGYKAKKSKYVMALVRSHLISFGKYLEEKGYPDIVKYPFTGLKTKMPRTRRVLVYSNDELNEFYNIVLFGSGPHITLFVKLIIQTGVRPLHGYYITCGDIGDKPFKDAFDRTYYQISARQILEREKMKIGEEVRRKFPPDFVYISESLRNEIIDWCKSNKLSSTGYIFKDFKLLESYDEHIRSRRNKPYIKSRLKSKKKYLLVGLRHTWASVIYSVTGGDVGELMDLGGWADDATVLKVYRSSMDESEAFKIAKNWEMYLPPGKKEKIERIQAGLVKKEETEVTIPTEELDKLWEVLEKQAEERKKDKEDYEKRIKELEKRLKKEGK